MLLKPLSCVQFYSAAVLASRLGFNSDHRKPQGVRLANYGSHPPCSGNPSLRTTRLRAIHSLKRCLHDIHSLHRVFVNRTVTPCADRAALLSALDNTHKPSARDSQCIFCLSVGILKFSLYWSFITGSSHSNAPGKRSRTMKFSFSIWRLFGSGNRKSSFWFLFVYRLIQKYSSA